MLSLSLWLCYVGGRLDSTTGIVYLLMCITRASKRRHRIGSIKHFVVCGWQNFFAPPLIVFVSLILSRALSRKTRKTNKKKNREKKLVFQCYNAKKGLKRHTLVGTDCKFNYGQCRYTLSRAAQRLYNLTSAHTVAARPDSQTKPRKNCSQ